MNSMRWYKEVGMEMMTLLQEIWRPVRVVTLQVMWLQLMGLAMVSVSSCLLEDCGAISEAEAGVIWRVCVCDM